MNNNGEINLQLKGSLPTNLNLNKPEENKKKSFSWRGRTTKKDRPPAIDLFPKSPPNSEPPSPTQNRKNEKTKDELGQVKIRLLKSPYRHVTTLPTRLKSAPANSSEVNPSETQTPIQLSSASSGEEIFTSEKKELMGEETKPMVEETEVLEEQAKETQSSGSESESEAKPQPHSPKNSSQYEGEEQIPVQQLAIPGPKSSFTTLPLMTPNLQKAIGTPRTQKHPPTLLQTLQASELNTRRTQIELVASGNEIGSMEVSDEISKLNTYMENLKNPKENKRELVTSLAEFIKKQLEEKNDTFCKLFFEQIKQRLLWLHYNQRSNSISQTTLLKKSFDEVKETEEMEVNISTSNPTEVLVPGSNYDKLDEKSLLIEVLHNAILLLREHVRLLDFQDPLVVMCFYSERVTLIVEKYLVSAFDQHNFVKIYLQQLNTNENQEDTPFSKKNNEERGKAILLAHRWYMTTDQLIHVLIGKISNLKDKLGKDRELFSHYLKGLVTIVEAPVFFITTTKLKKLYTFMQDYEHDPLFQQFQKDFDKLRQPILKRSKKQEQMPAKVGTATLKNGKVIESALFKKLRLKKISPFTFADIEAAIAATFQPMNGKKMNDLIDQFAMDLKKIEATFLSKILHREFAIKQSQSAPVLLSSVESIESLSRQESNSPTSETQKKEESPTNSSGSAITAEQSSPKQHAISNLGRYIKYSDLLTLFIATKITTAPESEISSRWLIFFIKVMASSRNLGNYSSAFAIKAALSNAGVLRLKEIWRTVSEKDIKSWREIEILFQSNNPYLKNYWDEMEKKENQQKKITASNCIIPLLSQSKSQFTFAEEGNKKYTIEYAIKKTGQKVTLIEPVLNNDRVTILAQIHATFYRYQQNIFLFEKELLDEVYTFNFLQEIKNKENELIEAKTTVANALDKLYSKSGSLAALPEGYASAAETMSQFESLANTVMEPETESSRTTPSATIYTTPSPPRDDITLVEE